MQKLKLSSSLFLVFIANSGNLTSYLFQFISARHLSPTDYGIFNALNSFLIFLSAPLPIIGLLMTRVSVKLIFQEKINLTPFLAYVLKRVGIIVAILFGLGVVGVKELMGYFHLNSPFPVIIMILQYSVGLLLPIFLGIIQGLRYYIQYALFLASGLWFRLLCGLVIIFFTQFTVSYALGCGLMGYIFALSISLFFLLKIGMKLESVENRTDYNSIFKDVLFNEAKKNFLPLAITSFAVSGALNLDISFVRHYIPGEQAGLYSVGAILGRVSFYVPGILMSILFAETLHEQRTSSAYRLIFISSLLSGLYCLICWISPDLLIKILMGKKYIGASSYLKIISLAMAIFSLGNALFTYEMARENYGYLFSLLGGFALSVILITFRFHQTPMEIAMGFFIGCTVSTLGGVGYSYLMTRNRPPKSVQNRG